MPDELLNADSGDNSLEPFVLALPPDLQNEAQAVVALLEQDRDEEPTARVAMLRLKQLKERDASDGTKIAHFTLQVMQAYIERGCDASSELVTQLYFAARHNTLLASVLARIAEHEAEIHVYEGPHAGLRYQVAKTLEYCDPEAVSQAQESPSVSKDELGSIVVCHGHMKELIRILCATSNDIRSFLEREQLPVAECNDDTDIQKIAALACARAETIQRFLDADEAKLLRLAGAPGNIQSIRLRLLEQAQRVRECFAEEQFGSYIAQLQHKWYQLRNQEFPALVSSVEAAVPLEEQCTAEMYARLYYAEPAEQVEAKRMVRKNILVQMSNRFGNDYLLRYPGFRRSLQQLGAALAELQTKYLTLSVNLEDEHLWEEEASLEG